MVVFLFQLTFCFGLCCYTSIKLKNAEHKSEMQKAEFYSFLYAFHKQMDGEEENINKQMMATPGGPSSSFVGGRINE